MNSSDSSPEGERTIWQRFKKPLLVLIGLGLSLGISNLLSRFIGSYTISEPVQIAVLAFMAIAGLLSIVTWGKRLLFGVDGEVKYRNWMAELEDVDDIRLDSDRRDDGLFFVALDSDGEIIDEKLFSEDEADSALDYIEWQWLMEQPD